MALLKSRADFIPESPVHPKPFTPDIHGLIAWLETQDGETEYDYWNPVDCVLARFSKEVGRSRFCDVGMEMSARAIVTAANPWTYSAALSRARAFAAKMGG